jgi:hypothetical protein
VKSKGSAFVDDSGLGCTKQTPQCTQSSDIVKDLQVLDQEWERLLYSTGGALNLQKCFWFLLSWQWNNGQATCHTSTSLPHDLCMTSGGNTSTLEVIERIETTESYRTLGVWISPIGHNKGAMEILHQITTDFNKCIMTSHLNRVEAIAAYIQHLLPKVRFQLPVLSLSQKECDKLTSVSLAVFLPKVHVNRNTARSIVHGPFSLGGLAIPNLYTLQGIDKLNMFLGHLRLQDETGQLIAIDLGYIQLITGATKFFLQEDPKKYNWVSRGWITSLWEFMHKAEIVVDYPRQWLPMLSRRHDIHLLPYFQANGLKDKEITLLNMCRLYLKVITLSDITSADGTYILPEAKCGSPIQGRSSNLEWPEQGRPPKRAWSLWPQSLSTLEYRGKLIQPLGAWTTLSHQ